MAALFRIEMLPARQGDCLWIEYGDPEHPNRFLIDGGTSGTYPTLQQRLHALPADQRHLDLFVVTHVDTDHIGGAVKLVRSDEALALADDIWFNGYRHLREGELESLGPIDGERLTDRIVGAKLPWNSAFSGHAVDVPKAGDLPVWKLPGGMVLTLLSPGPEQLAQLRPVWAEVCREAGLDPEHEPSPPEPKVPGLESLGAPDVDMLADGPFKSDDREANGSSIAFLAEFDGRRILFGADAHPDVLLASLNRLAADPNGKVRLDAFKLPHHGSKANVAPDLLRRVDCHRYLFSTDGTQFDHPDPEAVARVIKLGGPESELIFNYRTQFNAMWDDASLQDEWKYTAVYPADGKKGVIVDL